MRSATSGVYWSALQFIAIPTCLSVTEKASRIIQHVSLFTQPNKAGKMESIITPIL